jgi:C4-dicarboxylate-specific signal transduction histidine kinase
MEPDAPSGPRHLLIVDDEPVILQILRAVFEDDPYRLSTVGTGSDALRVLADEGCDVLITDKNLPDCSGMDLLKAAKERDPTIEVLIVTGYASLETALAALELGAFDYVLKPLDDVFDLKRKVGRALERRDMARENARLLRHLSERNAALERALGEARALQDELIQSEKLAGIGTLAAGVAHEISSPLFGIMGLAEAIKDEEQLATAREHAAEIVGYCRAIRDIVVDLSSYSRAADRDDWVAVDLRKVLMDAVRLVERAVPMQAVTLHLNVEADLSAPGKSGELQQVFVNLLKNGVEAAQARHGDGGGRVEVRAWRDGERVWATVTDDGVGIAADGIKEVFDPFYTTKAPGQGTGLGLNVVYRILSKCRGGISVESEPGRGTVFQLWLPAARIADPLLMG